MKFMNRFILMRYFLFVISLFINAFGVAFITKALLGTSPITSVTYVLSMFTALTMGEWTIIVNILFVILELFFMQKEDVKSDIRIFLLQIPVSLCFGIFIDCSMTLLHWLEPTVYAAQVGSLLIGCVILAIGITLEVKANIAMTSGEYFVMVISRRLRKEFGYVKLGFDITLVAISCLFSLVFMGDIYGVREGTVVAALAVGPIVHFLNPYYRVFDKWITEEAKMHINEEIRGDGHGVITIAREFGSGGHLLAEMLGKKLGLQVYDKEFIRMAAQRSGMDEKYIMQNEQSIPSFWLKCIFSQNYGKSLERSLSPDDVLFVSESKIIEELVKKGPCIIVGRCADFILKDNHNAVKVFCYSDYDSAYKRCIDEYGIKSDVAETEIRRINRNRIAHYEYYTGEKWGDPHHYNLMINTGSISLPMACELIMEVYRNMQKKH